MDYIENRLHHLSSNQLRALLLLAKSKGGIISSSDASEKVGKKGKALGGVFSSLSRQVINGQHLVMPWGRAESGRGLRWKLNEKLISQEKLLKVTSLLLAG